MLAHGAAFDAASWQDQAEAMADQGNSVLAVEDLTPEAMTAAVDRLRGEDESVADVATELAESAPGDNDVLLLPGSDHAQHVFDGDQAEPALEALLGAVAPQRP